MQTSHFTRSFLLIFSGPIIWAVHFLAIYGLTGIVCARPATARLLWLGMNAASWGTLAASLVAVSMIGIISLRTYPGSRSEYAFTPWMAVALGMLSIIAILWETLGVFLVPACV